MQFSVFVGIAVAIMAIIFVIEEQQIWREKSLIYHTAGARLVEKRVHDALREVISKDKDKEKPFKACIGYNTNLDLRANLYEFAGAFKLEAPSNAIEDPTKVVAITEAAGFPYPHEKITNLEQLKETIAYFLRRGVAAERVVTNKELFQSIVKVANELEAKDFSVGGNAALMASRFAIQDCPVLLGGAVGPQLAQLLDKNITVAKDNNQPNVVVQDEVHVILEYTLMGAWGPFQAPRTNRIIFTHDVTNSELKALEMFHTASESAGCQLMVISGLHMLEGQPAKIRSKRLDDTVAAIRKIPRSIPVHLELASMGERAFFREVIDKVVHEVDSIGLNEQELGSFYLAITNLDQSLMQIYTTPTVQATFDTLRYIYSYVGANFTGENEARAQESRRLSRIHFHFLHYHVLATRQCGDSSLAETGGKSTTEQGGFCWAHGPAAVSAGSLVATTQACGTHQRDKDSEVKAELNLDDVNVFLTPQSVDLRNNAIMPLDVSSQQRPTVPTWQESEIDYVLAPVLICQQPNHTVGLGDAISSMGLITEISRWPELAEGKSTATPSAPSPNSSEGSPQFHPENQSPVHNSTHDDSGEPIIDRLEIN